MVDKHFFFQKSTNTFLAIDEHFSWNLSTDAFFCFISVDEHFSLLHKISTGAFFCFISVDEHFSLLHKISTDAFFLLHKRRRTLFSLQWDLGSMVAKLKLKGTLNLLHSTCNFFASVRIYTVVYNILLSTVTIGNIKQEIAVCLLLSLSLLWHYLWPLNKGPAAPKATPLGL